LTVIEVVAAVKRKTVEEGGLWRKISIHLCHSYRGMKLKEIGDEFGVSNATVLGLIRK
jgi:hypothetical protein